MVESYQAVRQALIESLPIWGKSNKSLSEVLGWDVQTTANFLYADRIIVTLPHASANIFFPRAGVAWYAKHQQDLHKNTFHLRVVLNHTNFSDLGWRPYAWWYMNRVGVIEKISLFPRNKKLKHTTIMSQPPVGKLNTHDMNNEDYRASQLATRCPNRAWSYIAMTANIELAAGIAVKGQTLYISLDHYIEVVKQSSQIQWIHCQHLTSLLSECQGRMILNDGRLGIVSSLKLSIVFDNATNIALLSLLGVDDVVGGKKMEGYWSEVELRAQKMLQKNRRDFAFSVLSFPEKNCISELLAPLPSTQIQLEKQGINYSQGIALAEHGRFAEKIFPFL